MGNCEEELKRLKEDIKLLVEDRMEAGMKVAKVLAEREFGKAKGMGVALNEDAWDIWEELQCEVMENMEDFEKLVMDCVDEFFEGRERSWEMVEGEIEKRMCC